MSGQRQKQGLWLDPRTKLFLILICVLASMFAPALAYQFALVVLIAVLGAFFGKWKYVMKAVCFYALVCLLTVWIMAELTGTLRTMFVAFLGLFHKVYACGMLAGIVLKTTKVNEFLSAMNRVHAGHSPGGHAALSPDHWGGLALYQRRHADEGCFTLTGRLSGTSGHDGGMHLCAIDDGGFESGG